MSRCSLHWYRESKVGQVRVRKGLKLKLARSFARIWTLSSRCPPWTGEYPRNECATRTRNHEMESCGSFKSLFGIGCRNSSCRRCKSDGCSTLPSLSFGCKLGTFICLFLLLLYHKWSRGDPCTRDLSAKALWSNCRIQNSMWGIRFENHVSRRVKSALSISGWGSNITCENTAKCVPIRVAWIFLRFLFLMIIVARKWYYQRPYLSIQDILFQVIGPLSLFSLRIQSSILCKCSVCIHWSLSSLSLPHPVPCP